MLLLILSVFFLVGADDESLPNGTFKTIFTYENPKDEEGLAAPQAFASDAEGNTYVLDMGVKAIYRWDKLGKFIDKIGGPGQGPGEMNFSDRWGMLAVKDQHILVFDEQRIHFWNLQGEYLKTVSLADKGYGRWKTFLAFGDGFIVMDLNWGKKVSRLLLLDADFEIRQELALVEGGTYQKNSKDGWDFNPYAPQFVVGATKHELWYGNTTENKLFCINLKGERSKKLHFPALAKEVPTAEVRHQQELFARRKRAEDRLILPTHFPLFSAILPIGQDLICVAEYDPQRTHCKGLALDRKTGKVKAKFNMKLDDERSGFLGFNGRVVLARQNEAGLAKLELTEFVIRE